MREAAERRQQLELEHEQALAVLSAKQQEIDLLQKAQVEAKKEHEGAVHLLENHLDSMQAKVRELEERCRSQSEQFNMLSKELERFRVQAGKLDLLGSGQLTGGDMADSPSKSQSLHSLLNGLGKGNEGSLSKSMISEFIRPLQMSSGEKAELLSVKTSFLSRSTPSSPRRTCLSEMERELNLSPRAKPRYVGKVRLCVARYNYNPYDGPNEHPEAELPLVAGKYLYVYGTMDEDGFYEGELLDGQQGLVPSNFVEFVHDDEFTSSSKEPSYLNFTFNHSSSPASVPSSAVSTISTLLCEKLEALSSCTGTGTSSSSGVSSMGIGIDLGVMSSGLTTEPLAPCGTSTSTVMLDVSVDEVGEDIVPYPRRLSLIKQLAKSVIVSWESPHVLPGWGSISGYNVLVDQEVRISVPCIARTKFLVEKLNLVSRAHRISVQSVTERGLSDPLRCTLMVGKDVTMAPCQLRVEKVAQNSAELSWMPSDSSYSHAIFLDGAEYDVVKPGGYKYRFYNLKPMTVYKVRVVARPHQMPWHLSLEQREKNEIMVEFCTQHAGPPLPPQDVQVHCGSSPGMLQVRWKPPPLTPSGTSNGANVMGYMVCTKGQKIAEVMFPTAEYVTVELNRIQGLEAREVVVRTISAQGESQDSNAASIPHSLLPPPPHPPPPPFPPNYPQSFPHPQPQLQPTPTPHTQPLPPPHPQPQIHPSPSGQPFPKPKLLPSARDAHAKEPEAGRRQCQPWEPHQRAPSPLPPQTPEVHGLEPPAPPPHVTQRILPQPQGTPISNTLARAMARQAAQRHGANHKPERRNIFSERNNTPHSDEEDDVYDLTHTRRRGASVDDFLRGSELSRHHPQYSHSEEYCTESSRGSDLSDIMEEDEEDLYCDMQLEEGRRRSISSHNALKAYYRRQDLMEEQDSCNWDLQREVVRQRSIRSPKRLHSIPEVAEEEQEAGAEQKTRKEEKARESERLSVNTNILKQFQRRRCFSAEDRTLTWGSRQNTKSPDSGLDCGSEDESLLAPRSGWNWHCSSSIHSEGPAERRALATGRKRTLTRQCGMEEDLLDAAGDLRESYHHYYRPHIYHHLHHLHRPRHRFRSESRLSEVGRSYSRDIRAHSVARLNRAVDEPLTLGNSSSMGRADRLEQSSHRMSHGCPPPQRRPMMVPSIEITMENISEGSEGNHSPVKDDVYYGSVVRYRKCPPLRSEEPYGGYRGRARRSPDYFDDSEMDNLARIFVALFDYDPQSMSPNPDAAVEELPFKEGQIIKVFGDKDIDGFYRAEVCGRRGLIPCNMISEIETEDGEMMDQLLQQGFLPLNTPVEKIVNCDRFKDGRSLNRRFRKSKRERNRRSGRHPMSTHRMVALYDYDPRESSPNVDVEAELTFCAGDVIAVFGEIDEDGFYYGELNGHRGLVPSNFLEEVPDDVDVFLTEPQDQPGRTKSKRKKSVHFTP
ncbi:RIMS-binding protein 2 isoform X2 [Silurus meridionalis]|uniref:RIMS-binding protein 2 isoform X2 n=1 Tax=Silurus meridionalis TaxID=175797 RepID=UPI001EEBC44E|nr:RIMS-binding protein 2 isoform X2 [Silurus meridionalis]